MPAAIKAHIALTIISFLVQWITGIDGRLSDEVFHLILGLWAALVIGLYVAFLGRRANWARIILIVITLPWGLILATDSAKDHSIG